MLSDIARALPRVVLDHVAAQNNHNPDALMATFAPDALMNGAKRESVGRETIRAWTDKEIFGDSVTLAIELADEQRGNIIVRDHVDGDFDKTNLSPPRS